MTDARPRWVAVSDYDRSKAFYERALASLGLTLIKEPAGQAVGFGTAGKAWLWVEAQGTPVRGRRPAGWPHGFGSFRDDRRPADIDAGERGDRASLRPGRRSAAQAAA
jgi:catechol 2,3-dioxygenase-like lactoylglutathione lyase family enzyme